MLPGDWTTGFRQKVSDLQTARFIFNNHEYFLPGLNGDENHVLQKFEWPIIVFNSVVQFHRLGGEYETFKNLVLKRDRIYRQRSQIK